MAKAKKATRKKKPAMPRKVELAGMECKLKGGKLEWDGHVLSPDQVAQLEDKVKERLEIAWRQGSGINSPGTYARDVGFKDLLWKHRPSVCAREEVSSISAALVGAAIPIGTLDRFHFHEEGPARQQGAELLRQLALEAQRHVSRLLHLAESIRLESDTKLQGWTARWEEYDRI